MCVCVWAMHTLWNSEWVFGLTADQVLETICSFCEDMICVFSTTCKCFWKNRPLLSFLKILLKNNSRNENHQSLTCLIYTTKVVFSVKVHLDRHYFNRKIEIRNYCSIEKKIEFSYHVESWNTSMSNGYGYGPTADYLTPNSIIFGTFNVDVE